MTFKISAAVPALIACFSSCDYSVCVCVCVCIYIYIYNFLWVMTLSSLYFVTTTSKVKPHGVINENTTM